MANPTIVSNLAPKLDMYVHRDKSAISGVVVHRVKVSDEDPAFGDNPLEIIDFFSRHPIGVQVTGGKMPYPLLICSHGTVTQTVPLCKITPHARQHNPVTIAVACVGDFRKHPPTAAQHATLVAVCTGLLWELRLTTAALHGHDELPEGRADLTKECPGSKLPMDELRRIVTGALAGSDLPTPLALLW